MKPYVKPQLFFESYELSQNVAACRWDWINHTDKKTCSAEYDPDFTGSHGTGIVLFEDYVKCTIGEKDAPSYCYTNGADTNSRLFQS